MRAYQPTLDFHRLIAKDLPDDDGQDWANAQRGLIGTIEGGEIKTADGKPVWSLAGYGFLDDDKPAHGEPKPVAPGAAEPHSRAV